MNKLFLMIITVIGLLGCFANAAETPIAPLKGRVNLAQLWGHYPIKAINIVGHLHAKRTEPMANSVRTIAFSRNGDMVATSGNDAVIIVSDVKTGKQINRIEAKPLSRQHGKETKIIPPVIIYSLAFSPSDNDLLASAGDDGLVRLWNVRTGKEKSQLYNPSNFLDRDFLSIAFSSTGKSIASISKRGYVTIWNLLQEIRFSERVIDTQYDGKPLEIAFSPDDKAVDIYSLNWEKNPPEAIVTRRVGNSKNSKHFVAWSKKLVLAECSPHFELIALGIQVGPIEVREIETMDLIAQLGEDNVQYNPDALAFTSDDSSLLASAESKLILRLWDIDTKKAINQMPLPESVRVMKFSPDNKTLAVGYESGLVQLLKISE